MADQGRWFKLWVTAAYDPDLGSLSLEDFARWCLFGVYLKTHGTEGSVSLSDPALPVQNLFRVSSFECVLSVLRKFPNCALHPVTNSTVSYKVEWANWLKYQGDFSSDRVKRHREKVREVKRSKKRGEEKRGEEKKDPPTQSVKAPQLGSSEWPEEWKPIADRVTTLPFLAKYRTWLADLQWWVTLDELFTSCPKPLDGLLLEAVAYCESEGYVPRSKAGIRKKLKNCMEFAARRAEREAQERKR